MIKRCRRLVLSIGLYALRCFPNAADIPAITDDYSPSLLLLLRRVVEYDNLSMLKVLKDFPQVKNIPVETFEKSFLNSFYDNKIELVREL